MSEDKILVDGCKIKIISRKLYPTHLLTIIVRDRYNNRRYRGDVWNNIPTYLTRNIKFYCDTFMIFTYRVRRGLGHLSKADRCWIVVETCTWSNHQNIAPINDDGRTITRRNKHSHYGPQKLQIKDLRFR